MMDRRVQALLLMAGYLVTPLALLLAPGLWILAHHQRKKLCSHFNVVVLDGPLFGTWALKPKANGWRRV